MAYISSGTVLIVGKSLNDNSNSVRTVTLVNVGFVIGLVSAARSFFNNAVDVVVWNVVSLSLSDKIAELSVIVRVGAALFYANGYLASYFGEDLCFCTVCSFFFSFDVIPFGMS